MGLLRDHASAFVSAFVSKLACPSWWILWTLVSLPSLPCPPTISCNSCRAVALEPQAASMSCRLPESEWLFANIGEEWLFLSWLLSQDHPHLGGGHLGYGVVLAAEPVTSKYLPVLFIEESDINKSLRSLPFWHSVITSKMISSKPLQTANF